MSRLEAIDQYSRALKAGQKYYKTCVNSGKYPYPQALDEIFDESMAVGRIDLGTIDIPMDQIVGTKTKGRISSFAGNFMPLLEPETEFADKWIGLCAASLSDEGIRDPIRCFEYMGRFYIQEGNKRVSVLKSYGNPTISARVTRIIPAYSEDLQVQVYYEFMHFYKLSGLYSVQLRRLGDYARLQAALGFAPDHVWTVEERRHFISGFTRLKDVLHRMGEREREADLSQALMVWLGVFSFADLIDKTADELTRDLITLWPDVESLIHDSPITVSIAPPPPDKGVIYAFRELNRPSCLDVAFIYTAAPEKSPWINAHELGRQYLAEKMGSQVSAKTYICSAADGFSAMEQAIADGAKIIFAVTPPLISACRKIAALYPHVKILNCSLSMPYPGVRTYYCRAYETKFIAGLVAGIMARDGRIGYVADYPIFGVPAAINAFTLGARAVNPEAQVTLKWSCMDGDPVRELEEEGIRVLSRFETGPSPHSAWQWSLFAADRAGQTVPLAAPCWHWGKFYVRVVRGVFNGAWSNAAKENYTAVNYFWGLDSGVIDIKLNDSLPDGAKRLALAMKKGVAEGSIEPFHCIMRDQIGILRNDGTHGLSPEEILNMNWILDCIDGSIPAFDELREESKNLVRFLGIYRDKLQPETEEAQL